MPRSSNQKLKLLYLMQYLLEKTDEEHTVTVSDMIEMLEKYDIKAERKSIYDDIEMLKVFGMDIESVKSKATGYYVASREFQLPELKLLVDSVQSSKFITTRKTTELIKKIEKLASVYDGQLLSRQVYVHNRIKSMNESIYYNVDAVSSAITQNKAIRFQYFDYSMEKEKIPRHDGQYYFVSPHALIWDNENYYMLAYDHNDEQHRKKHFRVDKMMNIHTTETDRQGRELYPEKELSAYTKHVFGMYGGEVKTVKLRWSRDLLGVAIDRFGSDIMIVPDGEDHFTTRVDVALSPQLNAWLMGLGSKVEIVSPPEARQAMIDQLKEISALYTEPAAGPKKDGD